MRAMVGGTAMTLALSAAGHALAADPTDEDARIARLEAAVAALQAQVKSQAEVSQENAALKHEVRDLEAQVAALKAAPAATIPAAAVHSPNAVTASLTNGPPRVSTEDGRFSANLYALVQLDAGDYFQDPAGPISTDLRRSGPALGATAANVDFAHARQLKNGTDFRRARIGVYGNAFGDFQYRVVFDFGGSGVENAGQLYEAWVQYSGWKPFRLRVGAFPPLEGLADQDSTAAQPLLERAASADIARNFAAGDTRIAAQLSAGGDHWLASAAVTGRTIGVISSNGTSVPQNFGDPLAFVGRLAATPLHGDDWRVHVGVHASYLDRPANTGGPTNAGAPTIGTVSFGDQAELRIDGTKLINTGNIDARHADEEGAEFAAQWRGLLIQSEYDHFDVQRTLTGVANPHFQGWYVEGSWVLTGEARRYNAQTAAFDAPPVPHPIGGGGFGDLEVALRYADMNLNFAGGDLGAAPVASAIRGGDLQTWTAGLNWYPVPYVRIALEGQHVRLWRLSPNASVFLTPVGAQIGQSYNVIAIRTQLGF
jgi:phosphate-selective porin OprO/OprP